MKYNKMDFSKKDQLLPNGICKAYISHVWGYGIRNTSDRYYSDKDEMVKYENP